jgi:hypothetical protein
VNFTAKVTAKVVFLIGVVAAETKNNFNVTIEINITRYNDRDKLQYNEVNTENWGAFH